MQYSPKLKKAMEEIKEVLVKYDIAASITLHTPGHAEYLNHLRPSYSCADIDTATGQFTLKAKKIHFKSEAERMEKLTATSNMLLLLSTSTGENAMSLIEASEVTDKLLNASHDGGGHSSSTTQNN